MSGTVYLCDTSVYVLQARHNAVRGRFEQLLAEGRLAVCQMVVLEFLTNAPDPAGYERLRQALHAHRQVDVTASAMDRAVEVHRALASRSQHRNFALPDLTIAAAAELSETTVLHYDADYDRIAAVTGQSTEWVVPRGSL